jgi:enoyl-CoA hydratase/carnithine racemase
MRDLDPAAIADYYRATGGVYERVAALPAPTVAAIEGWCLGGGLELALACDFRVAGEGATFGLPEVGIGILPSSGGTHRLVRLVGAAKAKELVLLGEHVAAADAAAAGLVTRLAPAGKAVEHALAIARQAIDAMAESSRDAGLLVERLGYGLLAQTEDAREAATAFTEKRPPRFRGR